MSTQTIPIDRREELVKAKEQQKRQAQRADCLYLAGAVLVTAGVALCRWRFAPIAAGVFCLLPPLLELASGFVKGLRVVPRR